MKYIMTNKKICWYLLENMDYIFLLASYKKRYEYFIIWTQVFPLLQALAVLLTGTGSYGTDSSILFI